ncbi:hypothetical protein BDM02DRAFT_278334 [Thelephora ganbajun]|uniref:Uncharacterized protein n=1 Tax=Thelephora ganbajun TaxID=370292 RepID=A0ACB6Z8V3_THEGA|nr:hypothetical protein BDM02DRAFT_278334 [Thelephora ganbajun]
MGTRLTSPTNTHHSSRTAFFDRDEPRPHPTPKTRARFDRWMGQRPSFAMLARVSPALISGVARWALVIVEGPNALESASPISDAWSTEYCPGHQARFSRCRCRSWTLPSSRQIASGKETVGGAGLGGGVREYHFTLVDDREKLCMYTHT